MFSASVCIWSRVARMEAHILLQWIWGLRDARTGMYIYVNIWGSEALIMKPRYVLPNGPPSYDKQLGWWLTVVTVQRAIVNGSGKMTKCSNLALQRMLPEICRQTGKTIGHKTYQVPINDRLGAL
jgi:hypothetical protein